MTAKKEITRAIIEGMNIEGADQATFAFIASVIVAYMNDVLEYAGFETGYRLANNMNGEDVERYAERIAETAAKLVELYEARLNS